MIGAPKNDLGPGSDGGAAFLVLGGPAGWGTETRLASAPGIVAYTGGAAGAEEAGSSVAGAGDVNADGFDDFLVGASLNDTAAADAGAVYLVLGSVTPTSAGLDTQVRLTGEAAGDKAGTAVAGAGDANGDGRDDFIVGAPVNADGGAGAGAAYVVLGSAVPASGSLSAQIEYSGAAGDAAGTSVDGGDFNGDGLGDVIVGAPGNDSPGTDSGAAYAEPGSLTPVSQVLDGIGSSVRLDGEATGDAAGTSVAMGDVDGDGRDDFIVGAPLSEAAGADSGAAYFVQGRPGLPTNSLNANGLRVAGEGAGDQAGASVAVLGDVDGDSFGDSC